MRVKSSPRDRTDALSVEVRPQTTIDWWKQSGSYRNQPNHNSNRELNRKKKYWAKPDPYFLNEMRSEEASIDDFKKDRKVKIKPGKDEDLKWEKPNSYPLPDAPPALE